MENTLSALSKREHLQITCEEMTDQNWGNDRALDRSYGSGAIVHRDMETMKNSWQRRRARESNSKTFANSEAGLSALFIAMGNRSRERFRSFSRA